jgi:hypothetical protein
MKEKYDNLGVYKLKCRECPLQYIGQTGRTFKIRYKEHICDIRNNKNTSGFVQHVLDAGHAYGKINEIMEVVKIQEEGKHLNTLEKYHIYCLFNKESNLIITAQTHTTQFSGK